MDLQVYCQLTSRSIELPAAIKSIESARALFEKLSAAHPDNGAYADSLAGSLSNLSLMQRDQGKHEDAVALQAALGVQTRLVERLPDEDDYRNFLGAIYLNLGLAYESGDKFAEAEKAFVQALPHYRKVTDRHPEVAYYRQAYAMGLTELGRFYSDINKPEQSLVSLNEALAIWRQLAARDPEISVNNRELARCLADVGNLYNGQGRHAEALPPHQEGLAPA